MSTKVANDLPESVEDFFSNSTGLEALAENLNEVTEHLKKVQSRFIDLDASVKMDNFNELEEFVVNLNRWGLKPDLIEDLIAIYELLSTYRSMSARWGEAADWFLKNEYSTTYSSTFLRINTTLILLKKRS